MTLRPPQISVDETLCRSDLLCARVCPGRVFRAVDGAPPRIGDPSLCCLCGQCLAVCPSGAISHGGLDRARFEPITRRRPVQAYALDDLLRQRRSVRAYRDREIPRALLEHVVGAGAYGPTGAHGGEGWIRRITVVAGREAMREVAALTYAYVKGLSARLDGRIVRAVARWAEEPRAGRLMLDDMRMRMAEFERGRDVLTWGAPAAVFVDSPRVTPTPQADCDCALFPILLMADALGLGACWNGYLAKAASGFRLPRFKALRERLGVPAHRDVYAAATLGFPLVSLHSVPQREADVRWLDSRAEPGEGDAERRVS